MSNKLSSDLAQLAQFTSRELRRQLVKDQKCREFLNGFSYNIGGVEQTVKVTSAAIHSNPKDRRVRVSLQTPLFQPLLKDYCCEAKELAAFSSFLGLSALLPPDRGNRDWSLHSHMHVTEETVRDLLGIICGVAAHQFYFALQSESWPGAIREFFDPCRIPCTLESKTLANRMMEAIERGLMSTERIPESAVDELRRLCWEPPWPKPERELFRGRQMMLIFRLPEGRAHLSLNLDSFHPVFRLGCQITLSIHRPDTPEQRAHQSLQYNYLTANDRTGLPGMLGSWGQSGHAQEPLTYSTFLPRYLYRKGLLSLLVEDFLQRLEWIKKKSPRHTNKNHCTHIVSSVRSGNNAAVMDAETSYVLQQIKRSARGLLPEPLRVSGGFFAEGRSTGLFYYGTFDPKLPTWNIISLAELKNLQEGILLCHRKLTPFGQTNAIRGIIDRADARNSKQLANWIGELFRSKNNTCQPVMWQLPSWILPQPGDQSSEQLLQTALKAWGECHNVCWREALVGLRPPGTDPWEWRIAQSTDKPNEAIAAESKSPYSAHADLAGWWNHLAEGDYLCEEVQATIDAWGTTRSCKTSRNCIRSCGTCLHQEDLAELLTLHGFDGLSDLLKG